MRKPTLRGAVVLLGGLAACAPGTLHTGEESESVTPDIEGRTVEQLLADTALLMYQGDLPEGFPRPGWARVTESIYASKKAVCGHTGGDSRWTPGNFTSAGGTLIHPTGHELIVPPGAIPASRTVEIRMRERGGQHLRLDIEDNPKLTRYQVPLRLKLYFGHKCVQYCVASSRSTHVAREQPGFDDPLPGMEAKARCAVEDVPLDHLSTYTLGIP